MDEIRKAELKFRSSELIRLIVAESTSIAPNELYNWMSLEVLVYLLEPEDIYFKDHGQDWDCETDSDGEFERVNFYLRRKSPRENLDILLREVLPVIRGNLDTPEEFLRRKSEPSDEGGRVDETRHKRKRNYTVWGYPHDMDHKYLKPVEHKWEIGGFILGPLWIWFKGGPPLLALAVLAAAVVPFFVFGISFLTIAWALIFWFPNAWCHSALQGIKLKSIGHVRMGNVSAFSDEEAKARIKNRNMDGSRCKDEGRDHLDPDQARHIDFAERLGLYAASRMGNEASLRMLERIVGTFVLCTTPESMRLPNRGRTWETLAHAKTGKPLRILVFLDVAPIDKIVSDFYHDAIPIIEQSLDDMKVPLENL